MYNTEWNSLNWEQIEKTVFEAQRNIYNASKAKDISAVRNLQNILLNMYEPRLLAVKIVITNSGSRTPGIDQWIVTNDRDKFFIANNLVLDGTINAKIRKWIRKSTKLRGKQKQFWKQDTKDWVLYYIDDKGMEVTLKKYNSFKWSIQDYKAISSYTAPYQFRYEEYKDFNRLT